MVRLKTEGVPANQVEPAALKSACPTPELRKRILRFLLWPEKNDLLTSALLEKKLADYARLHGEATHDRYYIRRQFSWMLKHEWIIKYRSAQVMVEVRPDKRARLRRVVELLDDYPELRLNWGD